MIESAAVILTCGGRRVEEWERCGGALRGQVAGRGEEGEERLGYRAVGRMWRRFGWIGLVNVAAVGVDEIGEEYMRQLSRAYGDGRGTKEQQMQVAVRER